MKIVVATLYEAVGGSSKVLMAAAEALRAEHAVIVRAPLPAADSRSAQSLPALSLETWRLKLAAVPTLLRLFASEWKFIGKAKPDIVYVHDEPSLYLYGLICRMRGIRLVWHVHMREGEGLRRTFRNSLCDAKIFVFRAQVTDPQHKLWRIIANPISIGPIVRKVAGENGLVVGMMGSISALKNQECGIRVIAQLRRQGVAARLAIYGTVLEAAYWARLGPLIYELGLIDFVEFKGFVQREQALSKFDVLLACSTYESFGLAVGEALAAGIPVVASDIAAHREFLAAPPSPALAICPSDASAMADAVMTVRPDEAFSTWVRQAFSDEKFAQGISAFFRTLAA